MRVVIMPRYTRGTMPLSGSLNVDSMEIPEPSGLMRVSRLPGASGDGPFLSRTHFPLKPSSLELALAEIVTIKNAKDNRRIVFNTHLLLPMRFKRSRRVSFVEFSLRTVPALAGCEPLRAGYS